MEKPIVLIGLPGSGKSTWGKLLASELNLDFLDLDNLLEARFGCSISEYFAKNGEGLFRQQEHQLLKELLCARKPTYVLATGGGTPCYHNSIEFLLVRSTTVYLKTAWPELARRLATDSNQRPLLSEMTNQNAETFLREKFGWRLPFYQQADITVNSETETISQLQAKLEKELQQ